MPLFIGQAVWLLLRQLEIRGILLPGDLYSLASGSVSERNSSGANTSLSLLGPAATGEGEKATYSSRIQFACSDQQRLDDTRDF